MKRNFISVAKFLEDKFPELRGKIEGGNYPPPPLIELLANAVSVIQLVALLWAVMGGETLMRYIGYKQNFPSWYYTISNNAMPLGILCFLILPQIVAKFTVTGAFEIYHNGDEIWSKLARGAYPNEGELIAKMVAVGLKPKE